MRALALGTIVALAVGACGSAATSSPSPTATPSELPEASFTGGTASARVAQPSRIAWNGGWCTRGPDDAWLAVNIGFPNGPEYFGLIVGRSAYTPEATRVATGGGSFTDGDAVVTWQQAGIAASLAQSGLLVEVTKDLTLGSFSGHLDDGTKVSGSFSC